MAAVLTNSAETLTDNHHVVTVSDLTDDAIGHNLHETPMTNGLSLPNEQAAVPTKDHVKTVTQPTLAGLDASRLVTNLAHPQTQLDLDTLKRLKAPTSHMLTASWSVEHGWAAPEIKPHGPLSLMPTASVLHYATECFEGLKVYRGWDGKLRLFRPQRNMKRMSMSAQRIALPPPDQPPLLELIKRLCLVDAERWLPDSAEQRGKALYIRPGIIGTDPEMGIHVPKEALLFVALCAIPDPPPILHHPGLKLLASVDDMVRAWPGGFGYAKVGANYGPSLLAQGEAQQRGFDSILWLFGKEGYITEAGAANVFIVWRNMQGGLELVTDALDGKLVLDGVTRNSVLELAQERLATEWEGAEKLKVVERQTTMDEVYAAASEGRLVEVFTCGTAWFISPITKIEYKGKPLEIAGKHGNFGPYAYLFRTWLENIMFGKEQQHPWAFLLDG